MMSTLRDVGVDPNAVSVVIPTRDRPQQVRTAIGCALAQQDVAVEVVVVDDGSRVPLQPIAGERVVRHETSRGVAAARNAGIAAARAPLIAFLDDDDLWSPDKLRIQLAAMGAAGARWAYGSAVMIDPRGRLLQRDEAPAPEDVLPTLHHHNVVPAGSSNVIVHRDLLASVGGFDLALGHFADWDLWARLAVADVPASSGPEPLVAYVRHGANMHIARIGDARREIATLSANLRRHTGSPLDGMAIHEWIAESHSSAGHHWRAAATLARTGIRWRYDPHLHMAALEVRRGLRLRKRGAPPDLGPAPPWARPPLADPR